jgi:hypothetical protein
MIVRCTQCNNALKVPESLYGETIRCPACKNTFVAPSMAPDSDRVAGSESPRESWPEPRPAYREDYGYGRRDYLAPHRGTAVLILGILGIVVCGPLGIVAWVMGNSDLAAMRRGEMDPSGESMTRAGQILGIISTVLLIVGCGVWALILGAMATNMH